MTVPSEQARRASVYTLGCRLNQSETGMIAQKLREAGYVIVPFGEAADLGIINSCTVTREADAKSRQAARSFVRKNPGAHLAVVGCFSQIGYKDLAQIEGIDLIVGNQRKLDVLDYVTEGKNETPLIVRDRIERDDFTIELPDFPVPSPAANGATRANLKIQDGCDCMCTYCVVPFARGRARSRVFDNLVDEARRLVEAGVKEIVLTGINLGTYDHAGNTIADVVARLDAIEGLARVRISSIEPTTIPDDLLGFMADPDHALVPYLHIPVQSGSNHVLGLMKRKYSRQEFVEFIVDAHRRVPGLCIGTDILVGAPGETEADFEATMQVIEDTPIAYAHVFKYSERRNTAASRMTDKVDPRTLSRRSAAARRAGARKRRSYNGSFLGTTLSVLFEQREEDWWTGYTGNYIRVAVRSDDDLCNVIQPVRLAELRGNSVVGCIHDSDS